MKKELLGIFCFSILLLAGCKDDEVEPANTDQYKFFPLSTGRWIEYTVDSIVHHDNDDAFGFDTSIDAYSFQIREVIDTPFIDGVNETAYVVQRYKRDSDTLPWDFQNVWTTKVNSISAQRVEDNIRFIRLQFPIESSSLWNGNAYNDYPEEEYTYEDLYEQRSYNGIQFPSTVTVIQNDFESLINRVFKEEIYAKDVGMIYKQLDSVTIIYSPTFGNIIGKGIEYKSTIINYGQ